MTTTLADSINAYLERTKSAWNAGDAHALAAEFTDDATFVIFLGEALLGRAEIEASHIDVLGKWLKGTKMVLKALSIRALADDVASVLAVGGLGAVEPIRYDMIQTFTLIRQNERWMCSAFQNTKMSASAEQFYN
jgi:uncharacterized protein (TIGR02246 family)